MLHASWCRHRSRNVNDRRERVDRRRGANLFRTVHTVLHAEDQRAGSQQRSQRTRRRCVVCSLYAEENNLRTARCAEFGRRLNSHTLLKLQRVEEESVLLYGFDKGRASNHHHRRTRARQQSTEVATHGPRANDRNFWPALLPAHGVTTLMSRSMSRSLLYKCADTRMLPSRRLTTTFSFRRRLYYSAVFSELRAAKH